MNITSEVLEEFNSICKKDLADYFQRVLDFMQTDYVSITMLYRGKLKTVPAKSFKDMNNLIVETRMVLSLFEQFGRQFNNIKWWMLLEKIEEIDNRLLTLANTNRWARSSATSVGYNPSIQFEHVMRQNETLERVAQDTLGDSVDGWYKVATTNHLIEEGYTQEGGVVLKLSLDNTISGFNITSVVDMISGKSVYGKDLNKNLGIDIEESDLLVLNYDETILQAIEILVTLKKNDNPDFPKSGIQKAVILGGSRSSMNFPLINRQLSETFATDDSLKNFTLENLRFEEDNLFVDFKVYSRLGETMDLTGQL